MLVSFILLECLSKFYISILQQSWAAACEIQARCFHLSPLAAAAKKVAMSRFDQTSYLPFERLQENLDVVKGRLKRPMTLSEKILYSHLDDPKNQDIVRGKSYLRLRPDRVAMQVCCIFFSNNVRVFLS